MQGLFKSKTFRLTFLSIILLEILSFIAWALPSVGNVIFFLILVAVLLITLHDLRYGLGIALAELIVGSHGYLFSFNAGGLAVSLRMGIFLVLMAAALAQAVKNRRAEVYKSSYFWPLFTLAIVLVLSFFNGGLKNGFSDAFLDGNGYVYFALAFPLWQAIRKKEDWLIIFEMSVAALLASVVKVLFILYTFSHKFWWMMPETYRWIRDTRIGEITQVTEVFYRIFFASQIYSLFAFLIVFVFLLAMVSRKKVKQFIKSADDIKTFFFASLLLTVTLISMSRSNWVGLVFAGLSLLVIFFIAYQKPLIKTGYSALLMVLMTIVSMVIVTVTVLFPFPPPAGGFSAGSLFAQRALSLTGGEAAIDSRWGLLPPMLEAVKSRPIIGHGFGKTLTYITKDPRILAQNPSGEYTTFAFEWGYIEIWIKLGLVGFIVYAFFIGRILKKSVLYLWEKRKIEPGTEFLLVNGFFLAGLALLAIHAFSPYLNHPLGIGYLLFWALFTERYIKT